jgi:hypothetical protein
MYFPHLFARRAELLALRDICAELQIAGIIAPVLEAVKADSTDLSRCLDVLGSANVRVCVIVNPNGGDFKDNPETVAPWRLSLASKFDEHESLLPSFVCRSTTQAASIEQFLNNYPDREVAILYWSPNLTNAAIQKLLSLDRIRFHINLHNQMSVAQRSLLVAEKAVDVNDHFNHLPRNADYDGQEFFSDDHLNFAADSVGFGDYSVIGFRFTAGGGPAHAVAIHAIYRTQSGSLWVEHFVSDDVNIEVGSVEEKYLQAATKLIAAVDERPEEFGNDAALDGYRQDVINDNFPGLAMNKRRQIHHHLARVYAILTNGS